MTRTERLLAILQVLRERRRPVTAAQIAERTRQRRFAQCERRTFANAAVCPAPGRCRMPPAQHVSPMTRRGGWRSRRWRSGSTWRGLSHDRHTA
jgi:hypothetical protein